MMEQKLSTAIDDLTAYLVRTARQEVEIMHLTIQELQLKLTQLNTENMQLKSVMPVNTVREVEFRAAHICTFDSQRVSADDLLATARICSPVGLVRECKCAIKPRVILKDVATATISTEEPYFVEAIDYTLSAATIQTDLAVPSYANVPNESIACSGTEIAPTRITESHIDWPSPIAGNAITDNVPITRLKKLSPSSTSQSSQSSSCSNTSAISQRVKAVDYSNKMEISLSESSPTVYAHSALKSTNSDYSITKSHVEFNNDEENTTSTERTFKIPESVLSSVITATVQAILNTNQAASSSSSKIRDSPTEAIMADDPVTTTARPEKSTVCAENMHTEPKATACNELNSAISVEEIEKSSTYLTATSSISDSESTIATSPSVIYVPHFKTMLPVKETTNSCEVDVAQCMWVNPRATIQSDSPDLSLDLGTSTSTTSLQQSNKTLKVLYRKQELSTPSSMDQQTQTEAMNCIYEQDISLNSSATLTAYSVDGTASIYHALPKNKPEEELDKMNSVHNCFNQSLSKQTSTDSAVENAIAVLNQYHQQQQRQQQETVKQQVLQHHLKSLQQQKEALQLTQAQTKQQSAFQQYQQLHQYHTKQYQQQQHQQPTQSQPKLQQHEHPAAHSMPRFQEYYHDQPHTLQNQEHANQQQSVQQQQQQQSQQQQHHQVQQQSKELHHDHHQHLQMCQQKGNLQNRLQQQHLTQQNSMPEQQLQEVKQLGNIALISTANMSGWPASGSLVAVPIATASNGGNGNGGNANGYFIQCPSGVAASCCGVMPIETNSAATETSNKVPILLTTLSLPSCGDNSAYELKKQ